MEDVAVVIVSYNSARWLTPCLRSLYQHAGTARLDVVVVDNASRDGSAELVEREFPAARVLRCANRGFAYANNRALETVTAPFVLFLNADTEILSGTVGEFAAQMRVRPRVGLAGCRQLTPDGELYPTIRRFPSAVRLLFEALGSERYPLRASWLGERELDPRAYERESACDWTSGSFMFARVDAVCEAGMMDERFFLYCEEPDLAMGIKRRGWTVVHLPALTIVHHAGKGGYDSRLMAQEAFARRQYFYKHLSPVHRTLAIGALGLRHALRTALSGAAGREARRAHRLASRAALRALLGFAAPPLGPHPARQSPARASAKVARS